MSIAGSDIKLPKIRLDKSVLIIPKLSFHFNPLSLAVHFPFVSLLPNLKKINKRNGDEIQF